MTEPIATPPPSGDHAEIRSRSCLACNEDIAESATSGRRRLFCTPECEAFSRNLFSRLDKHVSSSSSSKDRAFEVPDQESQNTVNLLQHALQSSRYGHHRRQLRRLVLKTSLHFSKLPSSLFLRGVRCSLTEESHGSGSFADIYRGEYDGKPVALKRLRVFQMIEESKKNRIKQAFYHESLIWHNLNHRHVLPLLGVDSTNFQKSLCMVLPWMGLGNIRHATDHLKIILTAKELVIQILTWIHEVTLGLAYLHTEEIVHGDLRGANILVDADRKVRLADFGLAVFAEGASRNYGSTRGGNARWLAPEQIYPEQFGLTSDRPTYASDIFSMGCVCVELCTAQAPYCGISDNQVIARVPQGLRPSRPDFIDGTPIPDALWATVMLCWKEEPSHRPAAVALVEVTKGITNQREITPPSTEEIDSFTGPEEVQRELPPREDGGEIDETPVVSDEPLRSPGVAALRGAARRLCLSPYPSPTASPPPTNKNKRRRHSTTYSCTVSGCYETFTRQVELKAHMRRSHSERKRSICDWPGCNKRITARQRCDVHESLHHDDHSHGQLYTCQGCKRQFPGLSALDRHLRSDIGVECEKYQPWSFGQAMPLALHPS